MPKPYGCTAKGKIEFFLKKIYPDGATIEQLAEKFEVQKSTVKSHLNTFKINNMVTIEDNTIYWNPPENR